MWTGYRTTLFLLAITSTLVGCMPGGLRVHEPASSTLFGEPVSGLVDNSQSLVGKAPASAASELLRDPQLAYGVQHGWANTYPEYMDSACRNRWLHKIPFLSQSKWMFWEISETTYFCENPDTPSLTMAARYSSLDRSKQFHYDMAGRFRFIFDTSKEWRQGCNLSLPAAHVGGELPRFGDQSTNWPHFLIGQELIDQSAPDGKIWLGQNTRLMLSGSIKLNASSRVGSSDCPEGVWGAAPDIVNLPNHELFYLAVVLRHRNWPNRAGNGIDASQIYAIIPAFYSNDGRSPTPGVAPWINSDQFGNVVYFAPGHPVLRLGSWVDYSVDVEVLAREALLAYQRSYGGTLRPEDYQAQSILVGWEIWGGFSNDVEVRDLSLKRLAAAPEPSPTPQPSQPEPQQPLGPAGDVVGKLERIESTNGRSYVVGWACAKGYKGSIDLHVYAGGPHPSGVHFLTAQTSLPGSKAVAKKCGVGREAPVRFRIELHGNAIARHGTEKIFIYGVHPSGAGDRNRLLEGSGNLRLPEAYGGGVGVAPIDSSLPKSVAGDILGGIDGIDTSSGKAMLWGWACAKGAGEPVDLHLYVGGPHPSGFMFLRGRTSLPGENGVSHVCGIPDQKPIRFMIEIPAEIRRAHAGKPLFVYGIHPSGAGERNRLIGGSGYWRVPRI